MFVPKGAKYVFIQLKKTQESFLTCHTLFCHFSQKSVRPSSNFVGGPAETRGLVPVRVNKVERIQSKFKTYTIAFGFKDLTSSTSFGSVFN